MPADGSKVENASGVLYEHHAELCKVFSHPTRLRILNILRERERSVASIARELGVLLGTVSPHLLMMKRRRVLVSRKEENRVFYRLANPKMLRAFDMIRDILCEQLKKEGLLARELEQAETRKRRRYRD